LLKGGTEMFLFLFTLTHKYVFMRKILLSAITLFAFFLFGSAQSDFEKLQMEYEKLVMTRKIFMAKTKKLVNTMISVGLKCMRKFMVKDNHFCSFMAMVDRSVILLTRSPTSQKKYKVIIADSRAQGNLLTVKIH
jgi:hypothetical protein